MDDLMNKVSALIEAHVKSEVEAREPSLLVAYGVIEDARQALGAGKGEGLKAAAERVVKERDTTIKQFEWMREERDAVNRSASKYRAMWEQLHRAQSEEVGAAGQLKELLSALGLAHFDRSTIEGALKATRERDKRLVAERDALSAQLRTALEIRDEWSVKAKKLEAERDDAIASVQSWREKAQAFEAKLLEVRKAAAQDAPEKSVEVDGFCVGDLVEYARGPFGALYGRISRFDGDYAYIHGADRVRRAAAIRKPVEVGDTVRGIYSTFVDVVTGTSDYGNRCHFKEAPFRETQYLVAIAP